MKKYFPLTIRHISILTAAGMGGTLLLFSVLLFILTRNLLLLAAGLLFALAAAAWGALFLILVNKRLDAFSSGLCSTLDRMMDDYGKDISYADPAAAVCDFVPDRETLLSKIGCRVGRLYEMLYEGRHALSRQKEKLQSAVSDISHQAGTITGSLRLITETLLEKPMPQEMYREFLMLLKTQTEKLESFMDSLLEVSLLENEIITLHKEIYPLYETLVAAVNRALKAMEEKGIRFCLQCSEEMSFPHDCRWTSEAVYNLLDNAVKYTPSDGTVSVTVQQWEFFAVITVTDSGPGIPEEEQAAVFRRFYRGKETHSTKGLGIGLYLAREIITRQGGYIQVSSVPGQGASFRVFLPLS
ncbi:sensor histidine kinase [Eisenbergiella porci]|uniref:sensor histidine kinase n=1 Tax=Eisenbergiella porci TaxID=2652274 RepID=UPI002A82ED9D|nr:HAMP domain-containing sensor histidine kinase [Eisenbergiella porci]